VDADSLPEWLGGRSKGTLLDDVGPWSDPEVLHRMETSLPEAARALKRMGTAHIPAGGGGAGGEGGAPPLVVLDSELDGYHSPRCVCAWVCVLHCMCVCVCVLACACGRSPHPMMPLLLPCCGAPQV
jgi:hypothetical protein